MMKRAPVRGPSKHFKRIRIKSSDVLLGPLAKEILHEPVPDHTDGTDYHQDGQYVADERKLVNIRGGELLFVSEHEHMVKIADHYHGYRDYQFPVVRFHGR